MAEVAISEASLALPQWAPVVSVEPLTINDALDAYMLDLTSRKRRPAKASTLATFRAYRKWIDNRVGPHPIADFNNAAMRDFVAFLAASKLSPKTISEIAGLVKLAIGALVDPVTGSQIHVRVWNSKFIDAPESKTARRPTLTAKELQDAIAAAYGVGQVLDAVLWSLGAASGARISELQGIRLGPIEDSSEWRCEECCLVIRTSIWRGSEYSPKTEAANRVIELQQAMNDFIKQFTLRRSTQTGDYLFANSHGRPTDVSTLRERLDEYLPGKGFHSLRRFRARHLRANNVNDEITKYLLGHSNKDLTSRYSQLGSDADRRRIEVDRVGLGFDLPG